MVLLDQIKSHRDLNVSCYINISYLEESNLLSETWGVPILGNIGMLQEIEKSDWRNVRQAQPARRHKLEGKNCKMFCWRSGSHCQLLVNACAVKTRARPISDFWADADKTVSSTFADNPHIFGQYLKDTASSLRRVSKPWAHLREELCSHRYAWK